MCGMRALLHALHARPISSARLRQTGTSAAVQDCIVEMGVHRVFQLASLCFTISYTMFVNFVK